MNMKTIMPMEYAELKCVICIMCMQCYDNADVCSNLKCAYFPSPPTILMVALGIHVFCTYFRLHIDHLYALLSVLQLTTFHRYY
jgi:hypothetical protein